MVVNPVVADIPLPCLEPRKVYLRNNHGNVCLGCNFRIKPFVVTNFGGFGGDLYAMTGSFGTPEEEWQIIQEKEDNTVVFCSHNNRYLCLKENGSPGTTDQQENREKWILQESSHHHQRMFSLVSSSQQTNLAYNAETKHLTVTGRNGPEELWELEPASGELCLLFNPTVKKQVTCNAFGALGLSDNGNEGWMHRASNWIEDQVWRFVREDSHVYIVSWTHRFYLSSKEDGTVSCEKERLPCTRWKIHKESPNGLTIVNVETSQSLACNDNSKLVTNQGSDMATWHVEAAHKSTYRISVNNCRLAYSREKGVTTDKSDKELWKVNATQDGYMALQRELESGDSVYLGLANDGTSLIASATLGERELWSLEPSPTRDGLNIRSGYAPVYLCRDENGSVTTSSDSRTTWRLDPCLPRTMSGNQVMTLGLVTAASAVAAPFAVMGVVTGLGFTSTGITAGSYAAGMMSAEAIATGGGVAAGGTVATLQSVGAAGLGLVGTSAATGAGAAVGGAVSGATWNATASHNSSAAAVREEEEEVELERFYSAWRSWP